jgi:D-galactarolactone isomerase
MKPDDATTFDLLADWAPEAATRNRILVKNPALLYGFSAEHLNAPSGNISRC